MGERSCRSCQKSQLWTRGGARFFWRRACRKLRISAPRAGGEVVVGSAGGEERVGLRWEDMLECCGGGGVSVWCWLYVHRGHWTGNGLVLSWDGKEIGLRGALWSAFVVLMRVSLFKI